MSNGKVTYNKTHTCAKRARARKITPCGHNAGAPAHFLKHIIGY